MDSIINISEDPKGLIEHLLRDQDRVMQAYEDELMTESTNSAYAFKTAIEHSKSHDFGLDLTG